MRFFFFGTLMDRDILEAVIGRPAPAGPFPRALLPGYRRVKLRGESHPMILPAPEALLDGLIVDGLQPSDIDRIMFFESVDYDPKPVRVTPLAGGAAEGEPAEAASIEAHVFFGSAEAAHDDEPWDHGRWLAEDKLAELHEARLWMALYGAIDYAEADRLWAEAKASGRPHEDLVAEILARPRRARA